MKIISFALSFHSPTVPSMLQTGEKRKRCVITSSVPPSTEIMWQQTSWNRRSSTFWPISMEHGEPCHRGSQTPFINLCCWNSVSCFWPFITSLFSLSLSYLSQLHDFWRLDYWEDDLRRRRRFVRNAFGSTHSDVALKSLEEYGQPWHIRTPQSNLQCLNMSQRHNIKVMCVQTLYISKYRTLF